MPPTKGGITTFMLNLMASYLNEQFEFVPYTTTRPPKRDVIDNWGYGAVLRGGPVRIFQGILLTVGRFIAFPYFVISRRIDLVQIQASDYQVFWEGVVYAILARVVGRPVLLRIGGSFDLFHGCRPSHPSMRHCAVAIRLRVSPAGRPNGKNHRVAELDSGCEPDAISQARFAQPALPFHRQRGGPA